MTGSRRASLLGSLAALLLLDLEPLDLQSNALLSNQAVLAEPSTLRLLGYTNININEGGSMKTTHSHYHRSQRKHLVLAMVCAFSASQASANIESAPVIGGVFNASEVLKQQVVEGLTYSTHFARDVTLFTIGGVSLEAYILSLPLEATVKARVMAQIADPSYSIPLGYFLYQLYDRYTGVAEGDAFKDYLRMVYDDQALTGFQHSLFHIHRQTDAKQHKHQKDQAHQEGITIDSEFIATMVTVYDALVQIGEWQEMEVLPDQYQYLTRSQQDLALVAQIQPIIVTILQQVAAGMDPGDLKQSVLAIAADGAPEKANKPNNKAQALTITLIDFVRLNVLKAYRQFVYRDERGERLGVWLVDAFSRNPERVIEYLSSKQQRRFAVQVTVDGLQQGLMHGLVDPKQPLVRLAYQSHQKRDQFESDKAQSQPEREQDVRFMEILSEQPYHDPHYLPFFKRLYQEYEPTIADVGISSTPTISVRNLPIIKTGAKVSGPEGTGIPNFHFVDRHDDRAYYFFGNDALQLDRLMQVNQVQTMFDRLNYLTTLNCNAQYDWNAHTSFDALVNLGAGEASRDFGEKRCVRELDRRAKAEKALHQQRASLIADVREYQALPEWQFFTQWAQAWKIKKSLRDYARKDGDGMPDFTLVYNPWPDHFAHFTGPLSDEIIMPTGELNRLDFWLTQIENRYRDAGIYEKTLWGMAGDHGLTPVYYTLNPEKQIFQPLEASLGYPLVVKKISSDEGEGPKITNALNAPSNKGADVVVASTAGGNFMLDFFNSDHSWTTQPIYRELTQWQPVNAPKGESLDIIAQSLAYLGDTLDYLVVRDNLCSLNMVSNNNVSSNNDLGPSLKVDTSKRDAICVTRVVGERQGKRIDDLIYQYQDKRFYAPSSKRHQLLEVQRLNPYLKEPDAKELAIYQGLVNQCLHHADLEQVDTWCDQEQWRLLTSYTPRPDSVNQLAALYEEDRAGTVNLFPREGIGYNTKVPGRHAGETYFEKDAFIGFWGAPIGHEALDIQTAENGSLAPTLYQYLTGEKVNVGEYGWGYPSLLPMLDINDALDVTRQRDE